MRCQSVSWSIVCILLSVVLSGCTTVMVPHGERGTVKIVEGGLVETISFEDGPTFNIQITEKEVPEGTFHFPHVLTIGKFSTLVGSGFTKRSNIYYESRIGPRGHDTFEVGKGKYRVGWKRLGLIHWTESTGSVFSVTIEQSVTADDHAIEKRSCQSQME